MSCSTIHLFLGILCIFNIILYKSINLESTSIVEKFDIVSLQSQINLVKTQIASMKTSIMEQNKVLRAAMDKYFEEQNQKNRDEYEFQLEQDQLNHRLLSDMELNLSNLESQLKSEIQSSSQSQNIVFDLNIIKNSDNINLIINEINKLLEENKNSINGLTTLLNKAQNKYDLSKTSENKNELDAAIAGINVNEYVFNSINSYKNKFQSLLAIDKTDENIKKILAPTHYPIANLDPNFKNNESIYNQQIIILETAMKTFIESASLFNEWENSLKQMLVVNQNSSDENKQENINYINQSLISLKCLGQIMKILEESFKKCLEYTQQMIYIGNNPQPARTPTPTVQQSRTTTTTTSTPTTTSAPTTTSIPTTTSTPTRNAPTGQNYYDIVYPVDDKLNPIYPPASTETPNAYNSVSNRQMNNTQFVSNCNLGPKEKVVVDKLPLYYTDINEEDPEACKSKLIKELQNLNINIPTPSAAPSDSVKELKYGNTKNGSSIINSMIMLTVFCVTMLITTLLLPYLIDNQSILSGIITVINIAIIITIFILTYYLFDNSIKSENNKINISNYKFNIMTIMGYLVALMGLIIFFICGVPNMFLLFNPDQSMQPTQYVQPSQPIQQL